MNSYFVILLGSALGMLLTIVVASVYVQRSSKYDLGFVEAFKVYTTKHTGPIIAGALVVLIAMFILPDVIANQSGEYSKTFQRVINYMRTASVGLGIVAQSIGFLIVRKSHAYLKEAEENGKP